jgi:ferritin-like metal-binding protein YciE
MNTESLRGLYVDELRDAYSAENQILDALARMEKAASHEQLQSAFRRHREETQAHARRLEQILDTLGEQARGEPCQGMQGILAEGEALVDGAGGDARDAALISAAQRMEHYEIAVYGALRTFASELGREEDARLLQQTLDEEGRADQELTRIAQSTVNRSASG